MSDLLVGVHAKIARAEENIKNLNTEINVILNAKPTPYKVVGQSENNGMEYSLYAYGDPTVPPRIPVLIGEIAHNLRSSLDHLVSALIAANKQTITGKRQFPICTTLKKFEEAIKGRLIEGVTASAKDIIRAVRPYQRRDPTDDVLYGIQKLNNHDKHRLLIVATAICKVGGVLKLHGGAQRRANITGMSPPDYKVFSKDGVNFFTFYFAEPVPDFQADTKVSAQIAFPEIGKAKLAPVVQTLSGLARATRDTINMFRGEFP